LIRGGLGKGNGVSPKQTSSQQDELSIMNGTARKVYVSEVREVTRGMSQVRGDPGKRGGHVGALSCLEECAINSYFRNKETLVQTRFEEEGVFKGKNKLASIS